MLSAADVNTPPHLIINISVSATQVFPVWIIKVNLFPTEGCVLSEHFHHLYPIGEVSWIRQRGQKMVWSLIREEGMEMARD